MKTTTLLTTNKCSICKKELKEIAGLQATCEDCQYRSAVRSGLFTLPKLTMAKTMYQSQYKKWAIDNNMILGKHYN